MATKISKDQTYYGVEGVDSALAEILFVDPRISIEDAEKIIDRIKRGDNIDNLTTMLNNSFSTLKTYYQEISGKKNDEFNVLKLNIAAKMESWQSKIGKPEIYEILKLHEYLSIPISELPGADFSTPEKINSILSNFVIDQSDYTNALSIAFHIQQMRNTYKSSLGILPGNSVLCAGNSGMGKSHPLHVVKRLFDTDLQTINCNSLVQSGIVGLSVEDSFTSMYLRLRKEKDVLQRMEHSIVHFDEFDKLFNNSSHYNSRIVEEILHIIEGNSTISFRKDSGRTAEYENISSKDIMFVFTGVFESLPTAVAKRLNKGNSIGFTTKEAKQNLSKNDCYKYADITDYNSIGVIPEILGRINYFTNVRDLNKNSYLKILNNKANSPLNEYSRYFLLNGIKLHFTQEAFEVIASHVENRNIGARGIKQALHSILKDEMFTLSAKGREFVVDGKIANLKLE